MTLFRVGRIRNKAPVTEWLFHANAFFRGDAEFFFVRFFFFFHAKFITVCSLIPQKQRKQGRARMEIFVCILQKTSCQNEV